MRLVCITGKTQLCLKYHRLTFINKKTEENLFGFKTLEKKNLELISYSKGERI